MTLIVYLLLIWASEGSSVITEQSKGTSYEEGLVALYHFNENQDTFAYDVTVVNTATISGASWVSGKFASCLQFNGVDNSVDCGSNLHFSNPFTVMAWVNLPVAPASPTSPIIADYNGNYKGWLFSIAPDLKVYFRVGRLSDTTLYGIYSAQGISLNTWHHVVGIYDGTRLIVYLDGVKTEGSAYSPIEAETAKTIIGKAQWHAFYFKGLIDEVHIYNRVLTADEINAHFQGIYSEVYNITPKKYRISWIPTSDITFRVRSGSDTLTLLSSSCSWVDISSSGSLVDLDQYVQYYAKFGDASDCLSSLEIGPWFVKGVNISPSPLISSGAITFDIYFTEAMKTTTSNTPTVAIITESAAASCTSTGGAGWSGSKWINNQHYQITYDNIDSTMNGFATLRISGAVSTTGETMSVYENDSILLIDTEEIVKTSKIEFFPNPFSPNGDGVCESTNLINLPSLSEPKRVVVKIYNLKGKLIRALYDQECQYGAIPAPSWDGKDDRGNVPPVGVYIYQVRIGEEITFGTVVLVK